MASKQCFIKVSKPDSSLVDQESRYFCFSESLKNAARKRSNSLSEASRRAVSYSKAIGDTRAVGYMDDFQNKEQKTQINDFMKQGFEGSLNDDGTIEVDTSLDSYVHEYLAKTPAVSSRMSYNSYKQLLKRHRKEEFERRFQNFLRQQKANEQQPQQQSNKNNSSDNQ